MNLTLSSSDKFIISFPKLYIPYVAKHFSTWDHILSDFMIFPTERVLKPEGLDKREPLAM